MKANFLFILLIVNLLFDIQAHEVNSSLIRPETNNSHVDESNLQIGQNATTIESDSNPTNIIEIASKEEFNNLLSQQKLLVVLFHATWCRHSKRIYPEFSAAALHFKKRIVFISANTFKNRQLRDDTINETSTVVYDDEYKKESIIAFIEEETKPFLKQFSNPSELANILFSSRFDALFIGYFSDFNLPEYKNYSKVAHAEFRQYRRLGFAVTNNLEAFNTVYRGGNYKGNATILAVKEGQWDECENSFEEDELFDWIVEHNKFLVGILSPDTINSLIQSGLGPVGTQLVPVFTLFIPKSGELMFKAILYRLAKNHPNVRITYVDGSEYTNFRLKLGLSKVPSACIFDAKQEQHYILEDASDELNINDFITFYFANRLTPYLRSETPFNNTFKPGKVARIVSKNFREIVYNTKKNVLVYFYTIWCGFCQAFQPIYDALAESLAEKENILLVKIDMSRNDLQEVTVNAYPTFKLFPATSEKAPISYNGAHRLEEIREFIEKNISKL